MNAKLTTRNIAFARRAVCTANKTHADLRQRDAGLRRMPWRHYCTRLMRRAQWMTHNETLYVISYMGGRQVMFGVEP
jgi:hypothetical protein